MKKVLCFILSLMFIIVFIPVFTIANIITTFIYPPENTEEFKEIWRLGF